MPIRDAASRRTVASLSPGTGAQFSLLPPENATGNWVKVVQRVPVRLQLDDGESSTALPLHAGLSAEVTVDTEHRRTSVRPRSASGGAALMSAGVHAGSARACGRIAA